MTGHRQFSTREDKNSNQNKNTPLKGKPFPIGVTLLLILLFSCLAVASGICAGLLTDAVIAAIAGNAGSDSLFTYVMITAGLVAALLLVLFALFRHGGTKKNRFTESFFDDVLIMLIFLAVGAAVTLLSVGGENDNNTDLLVAAAIFPAVGLIATPNAIRYALKDMQEWEKIFYGKGNLHRYKDDENFYRVKTPVPFERKLFWVVLRNQVLDHAVVIGIMLLVFISGISRMINGVGEASPGLIGAIVHVRAERAVGFMFFAMVFFAAFGIPILVYYVTNAVCRLRLVKKHRYIAYHAIVNSVRSYKLNIRDKGRHYSYDYATCVGIREKDVHDTRAVLIFIPDDVLVFPDKEAV